mgnify:CR=1 FL=1
MLRATAQAEHTGWLGPFDFWHRNKPGPFNPAYDPAAKARSASVTASMEAAGYYEKHTRCECASEWQRRYAALADLQASNLEHNHE